MDFKLPDLGEGVTEAEIAEWFVKEGDSIEEDAPLVEVITDKASAEIPSPYAGRVSRIHVKLGEVVPVGTVLVTVLGDDEVAEEITPAVESLQPVMEVPHVVAPPPPPAIPTAMPQPDPSNGAQAMPPVRRLARDLGVDLATVRGTGPEGRILREDVEAAAVGPKIPTSLLPQTPSPVAVAPTETSAGRREPFIGVRRKIAERMTHAHLTVPPVTHVEECDVTELDATRKLANERNPELLKLTYMPFIVKAVVTCLKQYPALNASLDEVAGEIVYHDRYDIGIAIDTPAGLTVGVVHNAGELRLRDLAAEINRLAEAGRDGALTPDDLRDPTFTVSSPGGNYGGLLATPIVFHPQSAILGVHRAVDRPVARNGQVVIRKMMNLSTTFDHRILDGMTTARFMIDLIALLEHPAVLALES